MCCTQRESEHGLIITVYRAGLLALRVLPLCSVLSWRAQGAPMLLTAEVSGSGQSGEGGLVSGADLSSDTALDAEEEI